MAKLSDDELIRTVEVHAKHNGDTTAAALELGIAPRSLRDRLRVIKARADNPERAFAPLAEADARDGFDPYVVKGVSTLLDARGNVVQQWVKTKLDDEQRMKAIEAAIAERVDRITPLPPVTYTPPASNRAIGKLNLLTLTDCHIGMLAWDKETGADWDVNIARETLFRTFAGLLRSAPVAETCIINQLGDFLHFDGLKAITPEHGNVLDADTRYQKLCGIAVDVLEQIIVEALATHQHVHVKLCEGNHDESGSAWLRVMFRRLFRDNPRVTIDDSPLPYYAYLHGETLLGFHHGHKMKMEQLPGLFAGEPRFRPLWGIATRTYIHTGHHHCHELIEKAGAEVERHPTMSARDAFAARGGFVSDRRAFLITYDKVHGEVGRIAATPETYA